jgi:predicted ester cyclase
MDHATAQDLAESYVAFFTRGDTGFRSRFSLDFHDHATGQRGLGTLDAVRDWIVETFADRSAELHRVMHDDDTVMLWYTARARHVGSSHPRMRGIEVKGNEVTWPQVHVFRFADGLVVEHWAVRDDLALLDSARA